MHAVVIQKKYQKIPSYIHLADLLEIRIDLIEDFTVSWLEVFLKKIKKPWILTLRKQSQGGKFIGSEHSRLNLIETYLALRPAYLDLEYDVSLKFVRKLKKTHQNLKLIRSFHDFHETPKEIDQLIEAFYNPIFDIHKFAFLANSMKDTLRLMCYLNNNKGKRAISLIAMGKYGHPLRVVGKILKNSICYLASNQSNNKIAALSIKELMLIYNYSKLNENTKIFALIGQDISHSIGHLFHNFFFSENKINAVYIKIPLEIKELAFFFKVTKELNITGISITTPFKSLLPNDIIKSKEPVNTLKRYQDGWISKNTDGLGLFRLIRPYLKNKSKILLIGAGPTALEIYNTLQKKGHSVEVFNRSHLKAALMYPGEIIIKELNVEDYDIVINAASYKAAFTNQIMQKNLKKALILIDISYQNGLSNPNLNPNIKLIDGRELFFNQAIYQQIFWSEQEFSFQLVKKFRKKWM